jgi:hypothetical protein
MEHEQSNAESLHDEEDIESDTPIPSWMVVEGDNPKTLHRITETSFVEWADENVDDTQIGKQKHKTITKKGK